LLHDSSLLRALVVGCRLSVVGCWLCVVSSPSSLLFLLVPSEGSVTFDVVANLSNLSRIIIMLSQQISNLVWRTDSMEVQIEEFKNRTKQL
jgi:hypothetical protein